jgi:hypothetical protein
MLVDLYWTTWCCILEDCTLHSQCCVNPKPNISCKLLKAVPVRIVVFWVVSCRRLMTFRWGHCIHLHGWNVSGHNPEDRNLNLQLHNSFVHVFFRSFKTLKIEWRHYFLQSNLTENGEQLNTIHAHNETYLLTRFSKYRAGLIQNVTTDSSCPNIQR